MTQRDPSEEDDVVRLGLDGVVDQPLDDSGAGMDAEEDVNEKEPCHWR